MDGTGAAGIEGGLQGEFFTGAQGERIPVKGHAFRGGAHGERLRIGFAVEGSDGDLHRARGDGDDGIAVYRRDGGIGTFHRPGAAAALGQSDAEAGAFACAQLRPGKLQGYGFRRAFDGQGQLGGNAVVSGSSDGQFSGALQGQRAVGGESGGPAIVELVGHSGHGTVGLEAQLKGLAHAEGFAAVSGIEGKTGGGGVDLHRKGSDFAVVGLGDNGSFAFLQSGDFAGSVYLNAVALGGIMDGTGAAGIEGGLQGEFFTGAQGERIPVKGHAFRGGAHGERLRIGFAVEGSDGDLHRARGDGDDGIAVYRRDGGIGTFHRPGAAAALGQSDAEAGAFARAQLRPGKLQRHGFRRAFDFQLNRAAGGRCAYGNHGLAASQGLHHAVCVHGSHPAIGRDVFHRAVKAAAAGEKMPVRHAALFADAQSQLFLGGGNDHRFGGGLRGRFGRNFGRGLPGRLGRGFGGGLCGDFCIGFG